MLGLCILTFASVSFGQAKMLPVADTSTNATTRYISTPVVSNSSGDFSFQYVGTKLGGTVAGVVKLYGSVDGVNFEQIGTDSLALTNVTTNAKIFDVAAKARTIYRFAVTTTGTVSLKNQGFYVARKL